MDDIEKNKRNKKKSGWENEKARRARARAEIPLRSGMENWLGLKSKQVVQPSNPEPVINSPQKDLQYSPKAQKSNTPTKRPRELMSSSGEPQAKLPKIHSPNDSLKPSLTKVSPLDKTFKQSTSSQSALPTTPPQIYRSPTLSVTKSVSPKSIIKTPLSKISQSSQSNFSSSLLKNRSPFSNVASTYQPSPNGFDITPIERTSNFNVASNDNSLPIRKLDFGFTSDDEESENESFFRDISQQNENTQSTGKNESIDLSIYEDIGKWPNDISKIKLSLILMGPKNPKIRNYPQTKDSKGINRRFKKNHFIRIADNNEKFVREWLVYSESEDAVFCFVCKIFCTENPGMFATCGFKDWSNLGRRLKMHEKYFGHLKSLKEYVDYKSAVDTNQTIDDYQLRLFNIDFKYWKEIFFRLFTHVKFLAKSNIAFRGTNCAPLQPHNGIYLQLIEHIATYDPILQSHLNKYKKNPKNFKHRLSPKYQNLMINFLASEVNKIIFISIKKAKYYGIIVDGTRDISKKEQFTFVIRFVTINKSRDQNEIVKISEHFLGFVNLSKTSGEAISNEIKQFLSEKQIPFENMRSQSYDNGSNMSGRFLGCQSWILSENSRAPYIPCTAHSLNLVINDIADECSQGIHFFIAVANLYNFFQSSAPRWEILLKHTKLTLKRFSDTRWASRVNAIKPLMFNLRGICNALEEIEHNETDKITIASIKGILKQILNYEFICSLIVWFNILTKINTTSEKLQSPNLVLSTAAADLNSTMNDIQSFLLEPNKIFDEASLLANKLGVSAEFKQKLNQLDSKTKFIEKFLEPILVKVLDSCKERFEVLNEMSNRFSFFHDKKTLEELTEEEIKEKCLDLEIFYTMNNHKDFNGLTLSNEILFVRQTFESFDSPTKLLQLICNYGNDSFPNLYIALRLFLTIPITVASAERSFSKLKLIKTYLRSTMHQTRLNSLATISIEHEIVDMIDIKELVEKFMKIQGFPKL